MKTEILSYIEGMEGTVTWYQIARAMPEFELVRNGNLMAYLNQLVEEGLIRNEVNREFPHPVYYLTVKGRQFLERK